MHEMLGAQEVVLLNGHFVEPYGPVEQVAHLPPLTNQVVGDGCLPPFLVVAVVLEQRVLCNLFVKDDASARPVRSGVVTI
mgnify:CR=1 FL=1